MGRPNIPWICTDQLRSDSLGCYGNPVARTPNIDSIATAGARFTRHITPMQICSPSRATLFTGQYPRNHELIINGMALPSETPTITDTLSKAGYCTHSVGKQHLQPILAPAEYNLPDSRAFWKTQASKTWDGAYYGFQTIDLVLGESDTAAISGHYANWLAEVAPEAAALLKPSNAPEPPPDDLDEIWRSAIPSKLHYNSWITARSVRFVDQCSDDKPFFLFVSFPDPHHPFAPPVDYANRYNAEDMPLPRVDAGELERVPDYYTKLFPTDGGFRELYWAGTPDLEAGSMIPLSGVSDASMRLAIAHTYAMIDDGVGQVLRALERNGVGDETIVMFTSDHGESLVPLLTGEGGWQRDTNYGEYHPSARPELYNQTIRTMRWRLSSYPDKPQWGELFDLERDPDEQANLFDDASHRAVRERLGDTLAREFEPQRTVNNPVLSKW